MITFLARLAFRLVKLILVVAVLLGVAWIFRESLLRTAARTWVVDDPVLKADAIVVLGGGRDWRPFTAADMYLAGQSTVVLVTQPEKSPSQNLLQQPSEAEINTTVLTKKGVPSTAIRPLGQNVTSTRDEALALRDWVIAHQAKDILIPTDPFHTRRARWIFQRALEGTGATVHVRAIPHPRYSETDWWRHEDGFIAFQTELAKSLYYLLNY
ncbi:YdcF family protein [Verrucomicrobium spinosum]|uniref:YdcF family protein n=1 Tax=Verrucomicrobium spinosum TaxID=2736 RepID=UPI00017465B0|nr:YdcF family protein [Verrucomicrobium spinosum]